MPGNQILVIRGGAIGDFILTLPALAALRRQFPQTRLEVVGYPHIAQLAVAGGLADATRPIEARSLAGFFARDGELDEGLQRYFASFAIILSYLYDPDAVFETNVKRAFRGQFLAGPHRPDDSAGIHATDVFLKPLQRLAIFDADPVPRLTLGSRPNSGSRLALHPGSGSERKNWPETKWMELTDRLIAKTSLQLLLIGGEAEPGRIERLARRLPSARVETASHLPLPDLAAKLAACRGFLGHDSGITHLAAAVGIPGVVLWGDTTEAVWRPRSQAFTTLRDTGGLHLINPDRVLVELDRFCED